MSRVGRGWVEILKEGWYHSYISDSWEYSIMVVGIGFMAWDMTTFPLVEGSMKRGELENIKLNMDLEDLVHVEDKSQCKWSKMGSGTKMGPGRPKNQRAHNRFKTGVCVGLVVMNPTQLKRDQMDIVWEIYCIMFIFPNREKIWRLYSPYSVDVTVDCTVTWSYSDVVKEWHVDWAVMADMVESHFEGCHLLGKWCGSTCPSLGLPCGTSSLMAW